MSKLHPYTFTVPTCPANSRLKPKPHAGPRPVPSAVSRFEVWSASYADAVEALQYALAAASLAAVPGYPGNVMRGPALGTEDGPYRDTRCRFLYLVIGDDAQPRADVPAEWGGDPLDTASLPVLDLNKPERLNRSAS